MAPHLSNDQPILSKSEQAAAVRKVLIITLIFNLVVASSKLGYGYFSGLISLQADGYQSMFDGLSNVIGLIMLAFAIKPPDTEHPYGHQKLEVVTSLIIGILILFGLIEIGNSIVTSFHGNHHPTVDTLTYIILIATALLNIAISLYERHEGKRLNSIVLLADADHTMGDSASIAIVLIGAIFINMGYTYADTIAACIVLFLLVLIAFRVLKDSFMVVIDTSYVNAHEIKTLVEQIPEVRYCHHIRSRGLKDHTYLEFHLSLEGSTTLDDAGKTMNRAKQLIYQTHPEIIDIQIQLEPHDEAYTNDVPPNLL